MPPERRLPISDEFQSEEEYVEELLRFVTTSDIFQILCGAVHILDFFTSEPSLFQWIFPPEWQSFLMACEPMALLDFLLRDDLHQPPADRAWPEPPASLLQYVRDVRRLSLRREFAPRKQKLPVIPRAVASGMKVKKIHEVTNFADYVDRLADDVAAMTGAQLSHFVDFGSGQNYLGRTLASAPYNRNIVAVESKEHNILGAKDLDRLAGLAAMEKVNRNKKVYTKFLESQAKEGRDGDALEPVALLDEKGQVVDVRPRKELATIYQPEEGRGRIKYIIGQLETGDLSGVLSQIEDEEIPESQKRDLRLMAISIHSCGNLSHYGIRSMVMNPSIKAVAIVGCCYNLLTEKLGPPTYKLPYMRPSLQAINGRVVRESARHDPQGFPMSERLSTYGGGKGIRFNITARMMACQAPANWTEAESNGFFTRHFYRAMLQKMFLDRGVISKVYHDKSSATTNPGGGGGDDEQRESREGSETPFDASTNPVIIGSLRKGCYASFTAYVRGAISKLTTDSDFSQYAAVVREKMGAVTDEEIARYEAAYAGRRREVTSVWTLMAFSACVVESLIATDRWLFLREHGDIVSDCWVETVFDYGQSPRNLVVVGIKR
ncbi:Methyltransferase-like protein 25 [Pleurostoma richardsiae]|uniref:Methyltransferase-like protein 25 n=1 Tax=Pleurostoma richardsiae TaxID=41990 RepID=A0AA38RUM3_9PEZI|nr:Methyltransferase-like protein 25 [Pleurostoma richardsiae]